MSKRLPKSCERCGKLFTPERSGRRFCSRPCADAVATGKGEPDPTPAEIKQRAAAIRATWSDSEYYERAGLSVPAWTLPIVETPVEAAADQRWEDAGFVDLVRAELKRETES